MSEREQRIKEKLEHSGIFDFPSFYAFAHSWFRDAGFGVDEEKYIEKSLGDSREIDIEWLCWKEVTDYFKFEYKVRFEIKRLTEVEVEIDGQKKTMNKGKLKIELVGILIMDRESKWDTSPFSRFSRDLYNRYIIPTRVWDMKQEVSDGARNFKEDLKAFLALTGRR